MTKLNKRNKKQTKYSTLKFTSTVDYELMQNELFAKILKTT